MTTDGVSDDLGKDDLQLFTVKQVAELCVVTEATVRTWISDKRLPALKLSAGWRIKRPDLAEFLRVYYHV